MKNIKISDVNWNQVYSFSLVAGFGSIKKAAELLSLSPSALSEQVSQLESDLNVALFVRRGPKLILTEQGSRLFLHAKGMFDQGVRLLDAVSPIQILNYPFSVGFVPGPHLPVAYKWVAQLQKKLGPLSMKLQHCTPDLLESALLKTQFDFGFSDRKPTRPDLQCYQISETPIQFYVSTDWSDQSLAELLRKLPLLICRTEASSEILIEQALQKLDLAPLATVSSDFPSVLLDLCRMGLGVGAFCEEQIQKMNSQSIRSLRNPKDAPKFASKLYVIWSLAAENTNAVVQLRSVLGLPRAAGKEST